MAQIADPYVGLVSFQDCLNEGIIDLAPVGDAEHLFSHYDEPEPGTIRLTYARLSDDNKTVRAFLICIMNGQVDGYPCVAFGYAVPPEFRNRGLAQEIVRDVMEDQIANGRAAGMERVYFEAVIDVNNVASIKVAERTFEVEAERITDGESGLPALRFTKGFDTAEN